MKFNLPSWLLHFFFWSGALLYGFFYEVFFLAAAGYLLLGWIAVVWMNVKTTGGLMRLQPVHLFILLYVSIYWVSVLFAIDREQAVLEASRVTLLVPLGLIITTLTFQQKIQLMKSWSWIGAFLVVWGLVFGLFRDGRLESTFEYANTLAVFLLVNVIFGVVIHLKHSRLPDLLLLFVNSVGLILTFSRAVWVIAFAMLLVLFIWFPNMRSKQWIRRFIPGVVGIAGFLWVRGEWGALWNRLGSIQMGSPELQLRLSYWQDAWTIIRDNGWIGTGGGGWPLLQPQWYFSKYVHNQYLQILLDMGWIGFISFAGLMVYFYYRCIQQIRREDGERRYWAKASCIMVSTILLHAVFDLDLVFPFLFAVLISLIGMVEQEEAGWVICLSLKRMVMVTIVFTAISGFLGWMALGYGFKSKGVKLVQQSKLEQGMEHLQTAGWMVPWSNGTSFELAKGYVLLGHREGKASYYTMADRKIDEALDLVPENATYQRMKQELNQTNFPPE